MMTGSKYFFDTSLFIYALERHDPEARALFETALREGEPCTSVVTIMEYCTGCRKYRAYSAENLFLRFLGDCRFDTAEITREIAIAAAEIRASYPSFKAMDALQLACAKCRGCSVFYTSDKQLLQYSDPLMRIEGYTVGQ